MRIEHTADVDRPHIPCPPYFIHPVREEHEGSWGCRSKQFMRKSQPSSACGRAESDRIGGKQVEGTGLVTFIESPGIWKRLRERPLVQLGGCGVSPGYPR